MELSIIVCAIIFFSVSPFLSVFIYDFSPDGVSRPVVVVVVVVIGSLSSPLSSFFFYI